MLLLSPDKSRHWLVFTLGLAALFLSACGTTNFASLTSETDEPVSQNPVSDVSAVNKAIVSDIVQITEQIFPAFSTTLQFTSNQNDQLQRHFARSFANLGYGIQQVNADQGSHHFKYTLEKQQNSDNEPVLQLNASIGGAKISRDYKTSGKNSISPASAVRLSGTRMPVEVADTTTESFQAIDGNFSKVIYVASLNLDEQAPPLISLITNDLVTQVASNSTGGNSNAPSFTGLNQNRVETNNIFHTRESNFIALLQGRERISQQFIVFGNDSLVLGKPNKLLLEQVVLQKIRNTDLINIIGCSTGPTSLTIGNEGLALGRAQRVTEALLAQGVARERILDEGCWAPEAGATELPNRGVMLEIWRQNT